MPTACRAALESAAAGVKVLAGVNCFGTAEALAILVEHGLAGWSMPSAFRAVVSQRLVRRLCACRRPSAPDPHTLKLLDLAQEAPPQQFYQAVGCSQCGGTGYSGRTAIFSCLFVDPRLRSAIRAGDPAAIDRHVADATRHCDLRLRAIQAAQSGVTSLDELIRCPSL